MNIMSIELTVDKDTAVILIKIDEQVSYVTSIKGNGRINITTENDKIKTAVENVKNVQINSNK